MPKVLNKRVTKIKVNGKVDYVRVDTIPDDAIYVGRPTKWGNPFVVGEDNSTHHEVVALYEIWIKGQPELLNALPELRGHDLVCWCAPDECHADVLLRLANAEESTSDSVTLTEQQWAELAYPNHSSSAALANYRAGKEVWDTNGDLW